MRAIAAIFDTLTDGARAAQRVQGLLGADQVSLLTPESTRGEVKSVPTTEGEAPLGAPMGATLGGALGVAAAVMIPGLGAVTALGVAAAALFAAAGGAVGWKVGDAAERALSGGLPVDDLYFYEDALRQGRTVLVALVEDPEQEPVVREMLAEHGAESIDAARERWWIGLRDAESAHFGGDAASAEEHERLYRYGFTAGVTGVPGPARLEDLELWPYLNEHERSLVQRGYERGRQTRRAGQDAPEVMRRSA